MCAGQMAPSRSPLLSTEVTSPYDFQADRVFSLPTGEMNAIAESSLWGGAARRVASRSAMSPVIGMLVATRPLLTSQASWVPLSTVSAVPLSIR